MSGGMRQRVMIAMALSCNPKLLIADEPTTALDVTIQAQILDLMRQLQEELGTAIMLITHDLGVVAELVEQVVVMYAGKVVEQADVRSHLHNPCTRTPKGCWQSIPSCIRRRERLQTIAGSGAQPLQHARRVPLPPPLPLARTLRGPRSRRLWKWTPGHWAACWKHTDFEHIEPHERRWAEVAVQLEAAAARPETEAALLEVRNLVKHFPITPGLHLLQAGGRPSKPWTV